MEQVLDRHCAHGTVELFVGERQPRLAVQIVDDVARQLRIVDHLLGVQPEAYHGARRQAWRQMTAPAAHEVEERPVSGQHVGIGVAQRRDGSVVDVDNLAGVGVELGVGSLIVAHVGARRKQIVSSQWFEAHRGPAVEVNTGDRR